jgi:hypothetical protein
MTKVATTDVDTAMGTDTRRIPTQSLGTVIGTIRIIGTLRATSIIRGTSITGGITIMTSGASIIGDIGGMTAMIGRAATVGAIVDDNG